MMIKVRVEGCDDTTEVRFDATAEEALFLSRVADMIHAASTYVCMPRMRVEVLP